jgi:uncharacterized protein YjbI with pentapeptide repeats
MPNPDGQGAAAETAALAIRLDAHARWVAREPDGVQADLRQCRLRGIHLAKRMLAEAVMRDADLTDADLSETCLVRADLRFAGLRGANLRNADLSGALLDRANLTGADLTGARFDGASLVHATLDDVRMPWFDPALLSERLWRAADDDLELRMLAAFIGRTTNRCWVDQKELSPRHRRWILLRCREWQRDGDEAPRLLAHLIDGKETS